MDFRAVNPWSLQDSLHFSHAVEAPASSRVLFLALSNLVRLNYYVTDMAEFFGARGVIAEKLGRLAIKPSGCLLGISSLAHPALMVELEATAAA